MVWRWLRALGGQTQWVPVRKLFVVSSACFARFGAMHCSDFFNRPEQKGDWEKIVSGDFELLFDMTVCEVSVDVIL